MELRNAARAAFLLTDVQEKMAAVHALQAGADQIALDPLATFDDLLQPGRPALPALVLPQDVPRRSPYTPAGHAALLHSIAHIEFNAVNLALDAVWRFAAMPAPYYRDWLRVAWEEAHHFEMLDGHLQSLGYRYGDFVAHEGLWNLAASTRQDLTARMAMVPCTLEARGLDATPIIQAKLRKVGTPAALQAVALLDIILAEEEGHVGLGKYWYHWLCEQHGLDAPTFYAQTAAAHGGPRPKPPFNLEARRRAGFSDAELRALPGADIAG